MTYDLAHLSVRRRIGCGFGAGGGSAGSSVYIEAVKLQAKIAARLERLSFPSVKSVA